MDRTIAVVGYARVSTEDQSTEGADPGSWEVRLSCPGSWCGHVWPCYAAADQFVTLDFIFGIW